MSTTFQPRAEATTGLQEGHDRPAEGAAFAELYERYFPELYDFVVRTMGETERASEVVTIAFVQTLMGFRRQRTTAPVDAILFATARDIALDRLHTNSGTTDPAVQTFLQGRFVSIDAGRATEPAAVPDQDLAELVWQLLAAHAADEYSLIDLVLRRGIPVESLAPATSYSVEELRSAVAGIQNNVEDWITTALLIHRGSRECPQLNAALDAAGNNAPSAELRAVVQQHLTECGACPNFRGQYPTAAQTLSALEAVPAGEGVREAVWLEISSVLETSRPAAAKPVRERANGPSLIDKLDVPLQWWNAASIQTRAIAAGAAALSIAVFIAAVILLAPSSSLGIEDPSGFASTTHEIGTATAEDVVTLTWEENPEAAAYSVAWSGESDSLPDTEPDLDGTATGTKSPSLSPGEWYFHLRTQGPKGQWTSTVHLGPFVIVDDDDEGEGPDGSATPRPSSTAKPTPTKVATPTPTAPPDAEPEPEPTGGGVFVPDEPEPGPDPGPDPGPIATDPPAPTPVIVEGPCPTTVPLPEAAAPSDAMGPVQTVRQYYLLVNEGRYAEAYDLLTFDMQLATGAFADWVAGYASTTIVNPLTTVLVEQGVDYAVVYVEVVAVDVDSIQGNTNYLFQGTWVLTTDGGPWEMAGADIGVSVC